MQNSPALFEIDTGTVNNSERSIIKGLIFTLHQKTKINDKNCCS